MAFGERAQEALGPIHLWINNAGLLAPIGMARSLDPMAFATLMNVNVLGVFYGTRTALALFGQSGVAGTIVNISSGASRSPYAGWSAYCASKAAVDQFTRVVALEEAASGRRIYSLAPGVIETGMQELIRSQDSADFPAVDRFRGLKTEGLLGDPEGPAEVILKLAFGPQRACPDPCLDIKALRDDPTF
jgi:benzil reductase ((S)-benzoin forming)